MTKDEYEDWQNDPVTIEFKKYLDDSATEEAEILKEAIMDGQIIPEVDQYQTAIMNQLFRRIIEIDFEEIDGFYKD